MLPNKVSPIMPGKVFVKKTLIDGKPAKVRCTQLLGQTFVLKGWPITTVGLEDEWFDDIDDPTRVMQALRALPGGSPDIFTFAQRLPDLAPSYPFHLEYDEIAALPIRSYDDWWNNRLDFRRRNRFRRAEKKGVIVKQVAFDDDFVTGMTAIFNESPVRQGRPFWHYGKNFETVKEQFSRFIHREYMIGAYFEGQMIGFIMLADAGNFGAINQILSSLAHRDKSVNNALVAKAVEICAERKLEYLAYASWVDTSLGEFKRGCGFERVRLPRYYVPLTWRGRLALSLGAHHSFRELMPQPVKASLKQLRARWYAHRWGSLNDQ